MQPDHQTLMNSPPKKSQPNGSIGGLMEPAPSAQAKRQSSAPELMPTGALPIDAGPTQPGPTQPRASQPGAPQPGVAHAIARPVTKALPSSDRTAPTFSDDDAKSSRRTLTEKPTLTRESDGSSIVWDVRRVRPRADWRFLAWLALGSAVGLVLMDMRRWQFATNMDYLMPLALAAVGVILLGVTSKITVIERPIIRVKGADDMSGALLETVSGGKVIPIDLTRLTHVVFGLVDYPWPGRDGVRVEAYALYLACEDGTPIPVIDGTMDKMASFQIAKFLSTTLELPIIQLGKGA